MHRPILCYAFSCALMIGNLPKANALGIDEFLNEQKATERQTYQLVNPTATTCLEIMQGCSVITMENNSIELRDPYVWVDTDGSLMIEAIGSWQNARSIEPQKAKLSIRLARQLRPLPLTNSINKINKTIESENACQQQEPSRGQPLSLSQLAQILMGGQSLSERAAVFTSPCQRL
jgi:hypothetical protein